MDSGQWTVDRRPCAGSLRQPWMKTPRLVEESGLHCGLPNLFGHFQSGIKEACSPRRSQALSLVVPLGCTPLTCHVRCRRRLSVATGDGAVAIRCTYCAGVSTHTHVPSINDIRSFRPALRRCGSWTSGMSCRSRTMRRPGDSRCGSRRPSGCRGSRSARR